MTNEKYNIKNPRIHRGSQGRLLGFTHVLKTAAGRVAVPSNQNRHE